ncbi:flap endonuclease 1 [Planococcus citri]|uniref:flap endonuclease 1 n=1 Tax=Planococcus citri TaxID=170843 RepID=UPI0031F74F9C
MGIQGLAKLIADEAASSVKQCDIKSYFGRKIAIDATMSLYQFLIAVRSEGMQLTSVDGETTSHLMGTFYRSIRLIENGIKPVYVFDGKPPEMKSGELAKRAERREEAQKNLEAAEETGDNNLVDKFSKRLVKVNSKHVEECKDLLKLMGIPFVEAPCEAEAQCAAMTKAGLVYATATEDMDALTFGSPVLVRHLTFSEARKVPVQEYHLSKVLAGMNLTYDEFIDLCMLLGCDYCDSIRGVGPKRAMEFIREYRSISKIIENIDSKKFTLPENWNYEQAKELFINPEVKDPKTIELKWTEADEDGLVKFLCGDRQFNEERIRNGAKKLNKLRTGSVQGRLDSFFTVTPSPNANKRKADDKKQNSTKKGKAGGGKFRGKPK